VSDYQTLHHYKPLNFSICCMLLYGISSYDQASLSFPPPVYNTHLPPSHCSRAVFVNTGSRNYVNSLSATFRPTCNWITQPLILIVGLVILVQKLGLRGHQAHASWLYLVRVAHERLRLTAIFTDKSRTIAVDHEFCWPHKGKGNYPKFFIDILLL
jgi:hypothetical protein